MRAVPATSLAAGSPWNRPHLGSDRITGVSRVKAVGVDVPSGPVADAFGHAIADTFGHSLADAFGPTPVELSRLSFRDSSKFRFGPRKVTQAVDAEEHDGCRWFV
ncbi:hypothetical protein [Streptomyces olivochromogenes]|uniref:hypothetical protein n=1 Tax=Streptomyces olivochromogenes TaxID=1963 RepID=UPI0036C8CFD9